MDKSWMNKSRSSREYLQGVKDFLGYASTNASKDGTISCPCVRCVNSYILKIDVVHDHLVSFGISKGYDRWYGETTLATTFANPCEAHVEDMELDHDDIHNILDDTFPMHIRFVEEIGDEVNASASSNKGPSVQQPTQVPDKNAQKFYDLLKDAEQPLYEGCTKYIKLSAILHLYHVKCLKGLTNDTITMIFQAVKDMLPSDAKLPKDYYEDKKIIKGLGLSYEKIHACPNDCMLFWKEHANDDFCKCGASRWITDELNETNLV
ncbi:hypothetical protein Vadar_010954 [Vaccinium darrowii]|uniref:Uncharacterized protein n=1 Tax=Vaccinium darrowii TaxID=229202 RepID=A0ACB7XPY4_9ERIC|nr:hypothetical protein Vadar_010954 [Vaccinium darrowii]